MADLQAPIDCLLRENGELKIQAAIQEVQCKEAEALKIAVLEDQTRAREDWDKAVVMARKFHTLVEYPSDIVNKARLYDNSMGQPGVALAPKAIRCFIDYNAKMEKLLKEM